MKTSDFGRNSRIDHAFSTSAEQLQSRSQSHFQIDVSGLRKLLNTNGTEKVLVQKTLD